MVAQGARYLALTRDGFIQGLSFQRFGKRAKGQADGITEITETIMSMALGIQYHCTKVNWSN